MNSRKAVCVLFSTRPQHPRLYSPSAVTARPPWEAHEAWPTGSEAWEGVNASGGAENASGGAENEAWSAETEHGHLGAQYGKAGPEHGQRRNESKVGWKRIAGSWERSMVSRGRSTGSWERRVESRERSMAVSWERRTAEGFSVVHSVLLREVVTLAADPPQRSPPATPWRQST